MSGASAIAGHGFPAIEPLVPTERIVIREVADGAGPSHLIAIGPYLLVLDPWAAQICRYALADTAAPPVIATMPRSFAPWRTRRSGDVVALIAEPFGPEEDGTYHLCPRTMMTITRQAVAAMADGDACGFPIEACDAPSVEPTIAWQEGEEANYSIGAARFATITPVGAGAEIHAIRHAGILARGGTLLWWSEVDSEAAAEEGAGYAGLVTASQYVGIFDETGGPPGAIIRLQTAAYAPLVAGAAIPVPTLLVKPGFEYVTATDGARNMLWVMVADTAGTQSPAFVLLGYPLDALKENARAIVSLVDGVSEQIDRNDPTAAGQITVPTPARQPPVGPREAWFEAARTRLEQQIAYRWRYPEGARERPCGGADLCAVGANDRGALGVGEGFGYRVTDKIDIEGGAQWMRPRQLIGVSAGEGLRGVPYSIGGFDLAESFAERLTAEYDGADPYPPAIGHIREGLEWAGQARHYPLGIDCSALVARIFGIGVRSTAEMVAGGDLTTADGQTYQPPRGPDHGCTEPVRHLRDIKPGDLLLRDGHIVIFSGMMPVDGGHALRVFEASSRTGRVCESVYDPTFFDGWWIVRMRLDGEGDCPRWIDAAAGGRG